MLGSIDCMHWTWKNCPTAWQGMYTGKDKVPTLILEAVASQDLWIWHSFFGLPGSLNDINVLNSTMAKKLFGTNLLLQKLNKKKLQYDQFSTMERSKINFKNTLL